MKKAPWVLVLAAAAALAAPALAPATARAATKVQTVTVTPTYQNPATGQIEDSGGASNQALGESMVVSTTDAAGLLETGEAGTTYLTLRFHLADQIQGLAVETSADGGSTFETVEVAKAQEDLTHGEASQDNTVDYRFKVPSADAVVRLKLDVIPMGREVTYFATVGDARDGNEAGFIETPVEEAAGKKADATADKGSAADTGTEDDLNDESGADAEGISEYDADGNEVSDDAVEPLSGGALAAVVGGVVAVAAIAGGAYFALVVRPRRAKQAAEAAKAAGAPDDGAGE